MAEATGPIGMFDSGVGGLAVLAETRLLLPGEDILYYADTAHFPYGDRSAEEIRARADAITRNLLDRGAKVIVVACNTATSAAIASLRASYDVQFVGAEPALKPAVEKTHSGRVALLVTPGTARGEKLAHLIDRHGRDATVDVIEAPGLADAVEGGDIDAPTTRRLVAEYAEAVRRAGADALALGCTHYAFLRDAFEQELGPDVTVIEPAAAIARHVARVLEESALLNPRTGGGREEFIVSGDAANFERVRLQLLRERVQA